MNGKGHIVMPFDLSNVSEIKEFIKKCVDKINEKFDGMVFSAGVGRCIPIRSENFDALRDFYNVSYMAYVALLKEFSSKRNMNDGSSIVAISSRAALFPEKGYLGYGSAKTAINFASEVAAQEFVKRKIRVNTICPEMVKTPMAECFFDAVDKEKMERWFQKVGNPERSTRRDFKSLSFSLIKRAFSFNVGDTLLFFTKS